MPSPKVAAGDVTFQLQGFSDIETPLARLATRFMADLFFPDGDFPPLKSNEITITRAVLPSPLYAFGTSNELIYLNCSENKPWQFTFQLAHELGHLASRSDLRFPRQDGNMWIEEAICGAYSVYAIRSISEMGGPLQKGAQDYLREELNNYWPGEVDGQWFAQKLPEFRNANTLTQTLEKLSGYIAAKLPVAKVIADNRAILYTPLNTNSSAYLADWKSRCVGTDNLPALLESLAASIPAPGS